MQDAMKTPRLSHSVNISVLTIALAAFSSPLSAQTTVSIRGSGATPEYCPPNADCVGLNFLLTRTGPGLESSLQVRVGYYGTATMGTDYPLLPNLVTFPPFQDRVSITSRAIDDTVYEGNETVEARLLPWNISSGNQYAISPLNGAATVTILENDPPRLPPLVSLELVERYAAETSPFQNAIFWGEFRVRRDGTVTNELNVFLDAA